MAYDDQNIFARILRGELPAIKVYEDDDGDIIVSREVCIPSSER